MAVVPTLETRTTPGAAFLQPVNLALDNAYPTGGYLLAPSVFNFKVIRRVLECRPRTIASALYTPVLIITLVNNIPTAVNLALVVSSTGAQVANGTDVSAASYHIIAEGH